MRKVLVLWSLLASISAVAERSTNLRVANFCVESTQVLQSRLSLRQLRRCQAGGLLGETDEVAPLAFVRMLAHGRISCDDLVEETRGVEDAPEVFGRLARSADFPTVQFIW